MNITIATQNQGKLKEYQALLQGYTLVPSEVDVLETGLSFHQNALLKAQACATNDMGIYIGDDSGIMIDALGGAPAIYSKRYGGAKSVDEAIQNVIKDIEGDPPYTAVMVCCIAAITFKQDPLPLFYLGMLEGEFVKEPKGEHGFAYDRHFYLPRVGKTLAQMNFEEKNRYSHRNLAADKLKALLENIF